MNIAAWLSVVIKKSEAEAYELKFRENYQQENVIHIRKPKTFETVAGEMLADSNNIKYSTVRTDMDIFKKVNESIGNININLVSFLSFFLKKGWTNEKKYSILLGQTRRW